MASIDTQILSVVIGEGASGGALGIGLCDKMLMLENTWFSVISPEGCASILWKDSSKAPQAAEALKLRPKDLMEHDICNMIIHEPVGGAHRHFDETLLIVKNAVIDEIDSFRATWCRKRYSGKNAERKISDSASFHWRYSKAGS